MKIAVCVKQVPDATVHKRIDPATKRLDRSGEAALNPTDLNAVEEALRIKEAQGGEVVLVSLGPAKAVDSLRKALAMGADRAVLVSDDGAAGSDLLGTARALAGALERESADLVLFGQASGDGDGAVLWSAVADRLRRPLISQVASLTAEPGSVTGQAPDGARLRRHHRAAPRSGRGLGRDQRAALPVAQGDHGREDEAAGDARRSPISEWTRATAGRRARRRPCSSSARRRPSRGDQIKIEDDGSAAQKVLDLVVERKLL